MKELTRFELATVKRTANSTKALRAKKTKIEEKIKSLTEELVQINNQIDLFEQPIKQLTGGFTSEEVLNGTMECYAAKAEETIEPANVWEGEANECGTDTTVAPFYEHEEENIKQD